jgi:D-3-phosphoglycerate dehydrogenase
MPKVLIADSMSPRAAEIFRERGIDVTVKTGLKPAEIAEIIGDFDGLAVRSATKVTAEIIEAAANLKVIGRAGIGVDTVDVPAATARGIVVMNTPFGNSITTAEHAIAMMFALARQIPQANASTHAGKWEKSKFMGVELTSKVLGIIGCGNIGSIVAERAVGLRMKVVAFDPFLSADRAKALGVEKVELDDLLARADFITLHTPLTNDTRDILNAASLAKTKKGVRIINCARGGLVVEADLRAALDSGHVAGAAFDVFCVEPAKENVLFGLDNVVVTPHLGASTSEAQENVALQIAEQMSDYLLDGAVTNAVNMPSVSADEAPRLTPYMTLAHQLGSLAGQLLSTGITGVTVEFQGEAAEINAKPVTASALSGLLAHALEEVNMVSAPVVARERNIIIAEVKRDVAEDYHTLVKVTVTTDSGTLHAEGTLVAGTKPRITKLGGVALEAELGQHMLYIRNQDKPGFIGALGTLLGNAGVNIATFHLGRSAAQSEAILLTEVDAPISAVLIEKVRRLPQVVEARALQF